METQLLEIKIREFSEWRQHFNALVVEIKEMIGDILASISSPNVLDQRGERIVAALKGLEILLVQRKMELMEDKSVQDRVAFKRLQRELLEKESLLADCTKKIQEWQEKIEPFLVSPTPMSTS